MSVFKIIIEEINRITLDILEKVMDNTVRRIIKLQDFLFHSYVTHFYSCISCPVINVKNGEVTFPPLCIKNVDTNLIVGVYIHCR